MRNYDLEFLKKFSLVIVFLMVVTVALMIGAYFVQQQLPHEESPAAAQRTLARIAPVGAVYAGSTGAVGSSRVDLQACKLEYSIVSPK